MQSFALSMMAAGCYKRWLSMVINHKENLFAIKSRNTTCTWWPASTATI